VVILYVFLGSIKTLFYDYRYTILYCFRSMMIIYTASNGDHSFGQLT